MGHETEYLEDLEPVNLVQYNGRDFPTIYDSLLRRLRGKYGDAYDDFGSTAVGIMLVHLFAYGMSQNAWYMDRRASDAFITTARSRGAVARLARGLGYKIAPATASSVDLAVSFDALAGPGNFKKGFRFKGPDDLIFSTVSQVNVNGGDTNVSLPVSEGEDRELAFTSNGEPWQEFELTGGSEEDGVYIADLSPTVFVNGVEWEEYDFLTLDKTNQFEVAYSEEPPVVRFGDNITGNIPSLGADVVIRYKVINGANGNVNSGTITEAIDELLILGSSVDLVVNNSNNSTGGADPADYERAKQLAPIYYASRGAAITSPDYFAHINSFSDPLYGSVNKGYAAIVRDSSNDVNTMNYAASIGNSVGTLVDEVNSTYSDVNVKTGGIGAYTISNATYITSVSTNLDDAKTEIDTANGLLGVMLGNAGIVSDGSTEMSSYLTLLKADIQSSSATTAEKNDMLVLMSKIIGYNNANLSAGNSMSGHVGSVKENLTTIDDKIDDTISDMTNIFNNNSSIIYENNSIEASVVSLKEFSSSVNTVIDNDIAEMLNYLSTLFDSDCKANIVNVPILTTDASGFYAAPSTGLINALQEYLNGICEVTQYVQVVSGYENLVYVEIKVDAVALPTIVKSTLKEKLTQVLEGVIKGKDFGDNLYLSDLYDAVKPIIGKDYINISITGPSANLNSLGNLITQELQIVTKGNLVVNVI